MPTAANLLPNMSPSEKDVVDTLRILRSSHPEMGLAKVLAQLRTENPTWSLSEKRLKQIMNSYNLEMRVDQPNAGIPVPSSNTTTSGQGAPSKDTNVNRMSVLEEASEEKMRPIRPFVLGNLDAFDWAKLDGRPGYARDEDMHQNQSDALLHQLDYIRNSSRCYRLYGRGPNDWDVTLNADVNVLFTVMLMRVIKEQDGAALFWIYRRLAVAARKVDVSASDLRSQLAAEYRMDPLWASPPPARTRMEAAQRAAAERREMETYRVQKIKLKKIILQQNPEDSTYIAVDERGDPIFNEENDGMDAIIMVPVRKTGEDWRVVD